MGAPGSDGTGTARGREVPSTGDHRTLFPERSPKTLVEGLRRLVREVFLERAARGVYRNPLSRLSNRYLIENTLVLAARPLRVARIGRPCGTCGASGAASPATRIAAGPLG